MKIAFQGAPGAYSELALFRHFGREAESVGFESFEEVFDAVVDGRVDGGLIPVENTIAGTVVENYDLLLSRDVVVIAEACMKICHHLLAPPGVRLANIERACSHPHALKQCKDFLAQHGIRPVPVYDTAGAARMIAREGGGACAAIASALCAEIYGLDILGRDIQSNTTNTTRFFVIVKREAGAGIVFRQKTALAFKIAHRPGSLLECLTIFHRHGLNLTKLESRPVPEDPWEYVFYTDLEGGENPESVASAVEELRAEALFVKLLGSFPRADAGW